MTDLSPANPYNHETLEMLRRRYPNETFLLIRAQPAIQDGKEGVELSTVSDIPFEHSVRYMAHLIQVAILGDAEANVDVPTET
jgi:hypothetical protein